MSLSALHLLLHAVLQRRETGRGQICHRWRNHRDGCRTAEDEVLSVPNPKADSLAQALAAHPVGSDAMAAFMATRVHFYMPEGQGSVGGEVTAVVSSTP